MRQHDRVSVSAGCGRRRIEDVMCHDGCRVITYASAARGTWYHTSKCIPVVWDVQIGRYVTVPEE